MHFDNATDLELFLVKFKTKFDEICPFESASSIKVGQNLVDYVSEEWYVMS